MLYEINEIDMEIISLTDILDLLDDFDEEDLEEIHELENKKAAIFSEMRSLVAQFLTK
jgi:hypothetical protein